jgi:hypothetical protein
MYLEKSKRIQGWGNDFRMPSIYTERAVSMGLWVDGMESANEWRKMKEFSLLRGMGGK